MNLFKVNSNFKFFDEVVSKFHNNYAGKIIFIKDSEYSGILDKLFDDLRNSGIIIILVGDDGIEFKDDYELIGYIRGGLQSEFHYVKDYTNRLVDLIKFNSQLGSTIIHNFSVVNLYINKYKQLKNKLPPNVFEAGFGSNYLGQLLGCCINNIEFNGVTPNIEADIDFNQIISLLNNLYLNVDIKKHVGNIGFSTYLEQCNLDRKFDLIYSHVVLEHVLNVDSFVSKIKDLLSNNGLFMAGIDLTSHSIFGDDFTFLEKSKEERDSYVAKCGLFLNRLREFEWEEKFSKFGLRIVNKEITKKINITQIIKDKYPSRDVSAGMIYFTCEVCK